MAELLFAGPVDPVDSLVFSSSQLSLLQWSLEEPAMT